MVLGADWLADTKMLTTTEKGLYATALALMHARRGPVPVGHLRQAAGCHANQFNATLLALVDRGKLAISEGIITEPKTIAVIESVRRRAQVNGRKGGRPSTTSEKRNPEVVPLQINAIQNPRAKFAGPPRITLGPSFVKLVSKNRQPVPELTVINGLQNPGPDSRAPMVNGAATEAGELAQNWKHESISLSDNGLQNPGPDTSETPVGSEGGIIGGEALKPLDVSATQSYPEPGIELKPTVRSSQEREGVQGKGKPPLGKPISSDQKRRSIGTRLPSDFVVPDEWIEAGHEIRARHNLPRADLKGEAEAFVLYWTSRSRDAVKLDWRKTWLVRCMDRRIRYERLPERYIEDPDQQWRDRMAMWRGKWNADPEKWPEHWGYPPGDSGCIVPKHLLEAPNG